MPAATAHRLCPECRTRTADSRCAIHGIATLATESTGTDIQPGVTIGDRYHVTRELGRGGHGIVWLAEHAYGLGQIALKVLNPADLRDEHLIRFHREAKVTAALQHPNIVRVLDFGQSEGGSLYLALEWLQGRTLEAELRAREQAATPMTETEALDLADDLLAGLGAAHAAGLVHRDLKPSNVILCSGPDGQVAKILDFGVAHIAGSDLTASQRAVGTPAYMSPEQCQDELLDGRSDLYALAVILFRCVAGHPPFRSGNDLALMWSHVHQPAPDVASAARTALSPAFADTIASALAKAVADRPHSAAAMRSALHGEQATPRLAELQPCEPPAQLALKRSRWPIALGIVVVASLALTVWQQWPRDRPAALPVPVLAQTRPPPVAATVTRAVAPLPAVVAKSAPIAQPVELAPVSVPPDPPPQRRKKPVRVPEIAHPPRYEIDDLP